MYSMADAWQAELETTSHRPYSTGLYFGTPGQNQGVKEYARDYQMVARVVSCGKNAPSLAAGGQVDASSPATGEAASNVSRPFPQAVVANQADATGRRAAEIQSWPESGIAARRQAIASDPYAEKKGCVSLSFIDELAASPAQAYRAVVMCRNRFFEGETLEVLSPGRGVFTIQPTFLPAPIRALWAARCALLMWQIERWRRIRSIVGKSCERAIFFACCEPTSVKAEPSNNV